MSAEVPEDQGAGTAVAARSGGYAIFIAAGIFLSRIAGIVRQGVLSYFLGTTYAMSAFAAAQRIPNFLQNLLGEGVLSASMIPVYSKLLAQKDDESAGKLAGTIASFLALIVAVFVLAGVFAAPLLVRVLAAGYDGEIRDLTIRIVRVMFPGVGLLVLSAWCLAVLNSHRRFFVPYVAPVLWNAAIIGALLLFGWGESADRVAMIAAWGLLVGCVLQFAIQVPFVRSVAPSLKFSLSTSFPPVRQVFSNFVPVVFSRGVVQVSAFIDEFIGSFLGRAALGGIAYAYTIFLLPFSLFGMSISASELPQMSAVTGSAEEVYARLRERLRAGLRQIAFFVVPSTVAFFAIGDFLVAAVYQRGLFDRSSTLYVWYLLMGYSVGLLAVAMGRLYSSVFYSFNDTRSPLYAALARVVLTAALGWLFAFPLRPQIIALITDVLGLPMPVVPDADLALGAVGLTLVSGIVSWIELGILRSMLRRRIGPLEGSPGFNVRIWGAALLSGGTGFAVGRLLLPRFAPSIHPIPAAIVTAGAFGIVYLLLTVLLRVPEVKGITRRLSRR
ncbi:MAG TPA: murein biosynthesis integral membrane protein MurJ [Thermoanaerobaculia bacterium]|nr:murein biosynthesis integral membrane protein MurJ [Thermoanaerobaculia bacterium]